MRTAVKRMSLIGLSTALMVILTSTFFGISCSDDYQRADSAQHVELEQLCADPGKYDGKLVRFTADIAWLSECTSRQCEAADTGDPDADVGSASCCNDCVLQPAFRCPGSEYRRIGVRYPVDKPLVYRQSECAALPETYGDEDEDENTLSRSVTGIFVNESDAGEGLRPGSDGPNFDYMIDAYVFGRMDYIYTHEGR